MSASHRRREALSLVEVLLTIGILSLALVPIISLFSSTHRQGFAARRLVDVTIHVQALLEALAELEPGDFPTVNVDEEKILMADGGGVPPGGTPRYDEVTEFFARPVPVKDMRRTVYAKRLATGELALRVDVEWEAIVGEARTVQKLSLPMVATPRNWE